MPKKKKQVWNHTTFSVVNRYKTFCNGKLRVSKSVYTTNINHLPDGRRYWWEDGVVLRWLVENGKVVNLNVDLDMGWIGTGATKSVKKMLKKFIASPALVGTTFPEELTQIAEKL